jgi:hypothetical protein
MMARRPISLIPTPCGPKAPVAATGTALSTKSGNSTAHSSACCPPMEPPITSASRRTPKESNSRLCARTMSRMVTTGKCTPYGRPVSESIEVGPVLP